MRLAVLALCSAGAAGALNAAVGTRAASSHPAAVIQVAVGARSRATRAARSAAGLRDPLRSCCSTAARGTFSNAAELERALNAHGVDTHGWGTGSAKQVADLLEELARGETVLTFGPYSACRWVNVAKVSIVRDAEHLVEVYQLRPGGRLRVRGTPLAEKCLYKESPIAAARRGLSEELGLFGASDRVHLDASSLRQWRETRLSNSYPTLMSHYNLHQFDAVAMALPRSRFQTSESEASGRLVHVWDWAARPSSSAHSYHDLANIMWH